MYVSFGWSKVCITITTWSFEFDSSGGHVNCVANVSAKTSAFFLGSYTRPFWPRIRYFSGLEFIRVWHILNILVSFGFNFAR